MQDWRSVSLKCHDVHNISTELIFGYELVGYSKLPTFRANSKKAEAFANHLSKVFTPNQITPSNVMQEVNKKLGETVQSNKTKLKQ